MDIQPTQRDRIIKICNHEAGHYIASRELKFFTGGINVNITSFQSHSAGAGIEPWSPNIDSVDKIVEYLERRAKVLYAGVIAEATDRKGKYDSDFALNEWRNGGGKDDYSKIRELVQTLRNIKYPDVINPDDVQKGLDEIDTEMIQNAGKIVMERLDLIQGVGESIYRKIKKYNVNYELSEDEINNIPKIRELYID